MKKPAAILFLFIFINISCNANRTNTANTIELGDTIQTESGLKYYYVEQGNGRKIESGAKVSTYLSLKINDSIVWTSDNDTDSLFTFIMNGTVLIKGFNEMSMRLRQGDEIVAIIPDSLGYGDEGSGDVVPPNATLIYDKFKVIQVDEPRSFLADTLFSTIKKQGTVKAIERNKTISTSADSINYHKGLQQYYYTWEKLTNESMHQEAADIAMYFSSSTKNRWMHSLMIQSLSNLGQTERAIDSLETMLKVTPDNVYLGNMLKELQEKLKAQ